MRVRLLSDRWRHKPGGEKDVRYYVKGDEIDLDDSVGEWLVKVGAAVDLDAEPEPQTVEEPAPEQSPSTEDEPVEEPAPERPLNAAKKELWEDYYRKVKKQDPPKNASKDELIAEVG